VDGEAFFDQAALQEPRDLAVVFDDEQPHADASALCIPIVWRLSEVQMKSRGAASRMLHRGFIRGAYGDAREILGVKDERPAGSQAMRTGKQGNTMSSVDASLVIQTDALTKRFGTILAVDRLSLQVPAGGVFGLLGSLACSMFQRRDVRGAQGS
ncbi:MAG: hypothetical protein ACYDCQ_15720, partial [Dehalococcoidia bacterium]